LLLLWRLLLLLLLGGGFAWVGLIVCVARPVLHHSWRIQQSYDVIQHVYSAAAATAVAA
jgi:hypothetical protein